jgi:hypothetical protein
MMNSVAYKVFLTAVRNFVGLLVCLILLPVSRIGLCGLFRFRVNSEVINYLYLAYVEMTSTYCRTCTYPGQHATEKGGYALEVDSNPRSQ